MNNLTSWSERPVELANLFNPAFLAILLARVSEGYKIQSSKDLPYPVAFLAMPLIIYPNCRHLLPKSAVSKLHIWLSENQEILFEFPELASSTSPYVREAILFGISHQVLEFSHGGNLVPKDIKLKKWVKEPQNAEVTKKAVLVGRLLGQITEIHSLFSIFGVRP